MAGDYEAVRVESAKALWATDCVDYAISSLKDEYKYPSKITSKQALNEIEILKLYAKDEETWNKLYKANWEEY